jgi:CheY-like chemotaxis protein
MLVPRILVVEDEPNAGIDLREQLTKLGYQVCYFVATGNHAQGTVEQSRPALSPARDAEASRTATNREVAVPGNNASARLRHGENEASRAVWRKSHDSLFASIESSVAGVRYHLVVERLPSRGAWDWAVWRSGDTAETALHGRASSSASAMAAAEAAAVERRDMQAVRNRPRRLAQG